MSAPTSAAIERVCITTRGGWSLEASVLEGAAPARGTALFVHGLGASSRSFLGPPKGHLVELLVATGWRAVLFDQRGHGGTAAEGEAPGGWSFDGLVRDELAAMGETLRGRFEGPLALVGHGLGGLAACAAIGAGAIEADALVLFGVNVWLPRLDASPLRRFVKASLLTRGPRVASAASIAGPWGRFWPDASRWWSADAWLDASGRDYLASLRHVRCPTLAFSSHADPLLCAPECAHAFATRLGAARLEHHVAGGSAWRGPSHGGLVSDRRAAPLWQRSAAWLAGLR